MANVDHRSLGHLTSAVRHGSKSADRSSGPRRRRPMGRAARSPGDHHHLEPKLPNQREINLRDAPRRTMGRPSPR